MTARTRTLVALAAFGLFVSYSGIASAQEASATGTWTWTVTRNDQEIKQTLKLKQEGEKLTGMLVSPRGETEISDGKVTKEGISFKVVREFNGNKFEQTYTGKVNGDKLNLKVEMERNGEKQTRDIEAKRDTEKA
jgi:hypothetical protein